MNLEGKTIESVNNQGHYIALRFTDGSSAMFSIGMDSGHVFISESYSKSREELRAWLKEAR